MLLGDKDLMVNEVGVQNEKWLIDRLKKEYAKKHGYKLIIIKYTYDSYESISEYMAKELKKIEI